MTDAKEIARIRRQVEDEDSCGFYETATLLRALDEANAKLATAERTAEAWADRYYEANAKLERVREVVYCFGPLSKGELYALLCEALEGK